MIRVGDIVILDESYDHPDVSHLLEEDPYVFDAEGQVLHVENVYDEITNFGGDPERILIGQQVEVEWDDGEGNGTYPPEWLIKIGQHKKPGADNPNRTFRSVKYQRLLNTTTKKIDRNTAKKLLKDIFDVHNQ